MDSFTLFKKYLDAHYREIREIQDVEIISRETDLLRFVENEPKRICFLLSMETKDVVKSAGNGLVTLGYRNHKEWSLFNFFQSIPAPYDWLFALYYCAALTHINRNMAQCNNCNFTINLPVRDRNGRNYYRARIRVWVSAYQSPEQQPKLLQFVIDLYEPWSVQESPITCLGEFENSVFPEGMKAVNQMIKDSVTASFLYSGNGILRLTATAMLVISHMKNGLNRAEIAALMHKKSYDIDHYRRTINNALNGTFGTLTNTKQWVDYLSQIFTLR